MGLKRVQRLKDSVEHLPAELVMVEVRSGRFAVEVCLYDVGPAGGSHDLLLALTD